MNPSFMVQQAPSTLLRMHAAVVAVLRRSLMLVGLLAWSATASAQDFSGQDLTGTRFDNVDFTGANFSNTNLTRVIFRNTIIDNADFEGALLDSTVFQDVSANGANFDSTTGFDPAFDDS